MSHQIPTHHPAVVLRSHYVQLRTLLTVAMIAVVGLTVAVVILATYQTDSPDATTATPVEAAPVAPGIRQGGDPEEDTRPLTAPRRPAAVTPTAPTKALVAHTTKSGLGLLQTEGRHRHPATAPSWRIKCPRCGRRATAADRFVLQTPQGPVERIKFVCTAGHWLIPHIRPRQSRWTDRTPPLAAAAAHFSNRGPPLAPAGAHDTSGSDDLASVKETR